MEINDKETWIRSELLKCFTNTSNSLLFINKKKSMFGGKLYKYCPVFDDTFTKNGKIKEHEQCYIDNIRESKLYFSNISNFNDPFDSMLGLSLIDLIKEYVIKNAGNEPLVKGLIDCIFDEDENIDTSIKQFGLLLCKHPEITKFKTLPKSIQIEKGQSYLKEGFDISKIIIDITRIIYDPTKLIMLIKGLYRVPGALNMLGVSIDDKISNMLDIIFSSESNINKIDKIFKITNENGNQSLASIINEIQPISDDVFKTLNASFKVSCFSTSYTNPLMWAHYANKHKGFCVEYDFNKVKEADLLVNLHPVLYCKKRPSIPMSLFDFTDIKNIKLSQTNESTVDLIISLLKKSDVWKYEDEWRIILFNKIDDNKIDFDYISKIILGCRIEQKYEAKIKKICNVKKIPVIKMKMDIDRYELYEDKDNVADQ